ncbi:MAG: hypothetical protein FWF59_13315 [Turicibacter sp.]|nr:hypothetical protein [Turicibacter sp.]
MKDSYHDFGATLSTCDELVIVSKCTYGGFSPFVKKVLDRSIPYISPFFKIINGEMHHQKRYDHSMKMRAYFYGEGLSEREVKLAAKSFKAFALNFHGQVLDVRFLKSFEEVEVLL